MKKYKINNFHIEVTRKCNMSCLHCMRGEAQNLTLDKDILFSILRNTQTPNNILFTGGEPFLEPDIILSVLDYYEKISDNINYQIVTNGLIIDKSILSRFSRLYESGRNVSIVLSIDDYHIPIPQDNLDYLKNLPFYYENEFYEDDNFLNMGKAYINGIGRNIGKDEPWIFQPSLQLTNLDNGIVMIDKLELSANGNISSSQMVSYNISDKLLSIGNLSDSSFSDIVNYNTPFYKRLYDNNNNLVLEELIKGIVFYLSLEDIEMNGFKDYRLYHQYETVIKLFNNKDYSTLLGLLCDRSKPTIMEYVVMFYYGVIRKIEDGVHTYSINTE